MAAYRAIPREGRERALEVINDSSRLFIGSPFLQLELMPKPVYNKQYAEAESYRRYFIDKALIWINDLDSILRIGLEEAERWGLKGLDALHLAAASLGEAEVLYTLEGKLSRFIARSSCRLSHCNHLMSGHLSQRRTGKIVRGVGKAFKHVL